VRYRGAVTARSSGILALIALPALLVACAAPASSATPTATPSALPTSSATPVATASPEASARPSVGWHRVRTSGPSPGAREDFTWTASPDGDTAYLFGGRAADGSALGDLWAFDLAADHWRRLDANGPPARFGHNAVWVAGTGLVIFAGQSGADFYNDLWAFDPATGRWRMLPASGAVPVARYGSCAAVGPDGRLWISHGFTSEGQRFADTLAYDFEVHAWTDETPAAERPVSRCLHACWWTDDGAFILYAGQTTGVTALGDLWQLTPGPRPGTNAWSRLELGRRAPAARNLYAAARWDGGTLVFGGQTVDGSYLSDTWLIGDDRKITRVEAGTRPPGRHAAELVADPSRHRLLLFGGKNAGGVLGDLWELTPDF
jgi:hypothetical protein